MSAAEKTNTNTNDRKREVNITAADLPLACPRPDSPLWARHPRVYLDVLKAPSGEVACPYCGTLYRFTGARPTGHH